MPDCFGGRSSPPASSSVPRPPPPPDGNSAVSSITHPSPTLDIYSAYNRVIHSNPHSESWRIPQPSNLVPFHELASPARIDDESELLPTMADLLRPAREVVENKLQLAKDSNLNRLIANFFQSSEDATRLLLDLYNSGNLARKCYRPVRAVVNDLPFHSLSQSQADRAYGEFAQFHNNPNPFPSPNANNLDEVRQCFSQLKNYLNRRIRKSNSRIRLICLAPTQSTFCAGGFCTAYIPPKVAKKDPGLQNRAARKLFVLEHELNSLDNLVKRLHNSVEDVRGSISFGLDRGGDKHSIEEVLKQLRREQTTFLNHLDSLKKHICHCHGIVNDTRFLLLDEVSTSTTTD